jgi:ketosteroid isomerase-like protein
MLEESEVRSVTEAMRNINKAWLGGRVSDLAVSFHPDLTMVFPGFEGRAKGRDAIIEGFEDFCTHAKVREYREDDFQVDVAGDTAIVTFRYEMVYERAGESYWAVGRDFWVFAHQNGEWLAVWRTMLDPSEQPA